MPAKVTSIFVYPVKSLGTIATDSAVVEHRGLRHDRRRMLIRADGVAVTQRDFPKLALVQPEINGEGVRLHAPGRKPLDLDGRPAGETMVGVNVFGSKFDAPLENDSAHAWFSDYLESPVRLVYMPDSVRRAVNPERAKGEGIVSFADGYPLMVLSEASLAELNSRLPEPVRMNRFRPNLVVQGAGAFEEDSWARVRIGGVEYFGVKQCDRCVMTTVSPERGEFDGKEPLRTLSTYRKFDGQVCFGRYMIPASPGGVRVGDPVEVLETSTPLS